MFTFICGWFLVCVCLVLSYSPALLAHGASLSGQVSLSAMWVFSGRWCELPSLGPELDSASLHG